MNITKKLHFKVINKTLIAHSLKSIWVFPVLLTILLLTLTVLRINGSSIGVYHTYFYGKVKDSDLILGKPRAIRSDEWIVNTQMTVAQGMNSLRRINNNLGAGEDMSVILDVPYKEWSQIFRPDNLSFFVLPLEQAFAFKWWLMGYLLVLSCYFFVLAILPDKRLFASLLSIALLFSPFVQWWYIYITLGPLFYSLFIATVVIHFMRSTRTLVKVLWLILLIYLLVCFALVLYPPFQIACGLVLGAFIVGYLIDMYSREDKKACASKIGLLALSSAVAGLIIGIFIITRLSVVHTIESTAYPGRRLVASGGYSLSHLFTGSVDGQLLSETRSNNYQLPSLGLTNQSEDSTFLLMAPFLLLPSIYVIIVKRGGSRTLYISLALTNIIFLIFLAWLYIPHLSLLGTILLLNRVPLNRAVIGLGLLNIIQAVLLVQALETSKTSLLKKYWALIYAMGVLVFMMSINLHVAKHFPDFIGIPKALCLALPLPLMTWFLLRQYYRLFGLAIAAFSLFIGFGVNPLYRGLTILTHTPVSAAIRSINAAHPGGWVSETSYLENFPLMNGAHSLTGLYAYPQLSLWSSVENVEPSVYNRYAHVNVNFYRDNGNTATILRLSTPDHFGIYTEACSTFLENKHIRYVVTDGSLNNSCTNLLKTVVYPSHTFYIYQLSSGTSSAS